MSSVVETTSSQRMDELGEIIRAYSDVTEKLRESHHRLEQTVAALRNELLEKNQLLERKNRLAALGEMAAGMAHEIRNPLGGIQLYASMLRDELADRPGALSVVGKISGGVKRLEALVSQVLQFTREMRANVGPMDLAEVVREAVELRGGMASVEVEIRGPETLVVQGDAMLMSQAILNLVINGVEACGKRDGGKVWVRYQAAQEVKEQPSRLPSPGVPRGGQQHFALVVEDNGPGINDEVMDRIFNPFFTTKESGTGLGLAIVHRIVEAHDGTIVAKNTGNGARFEIRI